MLEAVLDAVLEAVLKVRRCTGSVGIILAAT